VSRDGGRRIGQLLRLCDVTDYANLLVISVVPDVETVLGTTQVHRVRLAGLRIVSSVD